MKTSPSGVELRLTPNLLIYCWIFSNGMSVPLVVTKSKSVSAFAFNGFSCTRKFANSRLRMSQLTVVCWVFANAKNT